MLALIRSNACTAMLDDATGEVNEKSLGIHQGSSIAPVLSNIYLMDFDNALTRPGFFYVRYSDDMLVLGEDKEKLHELLVEIKARLEELGLEINENKTVCCALIEGIEFLGYRFDASGKSIPARAEDKLYDRLETMWLTSSNMDFDEKAAKALEIVGGWQQYYRDERRIQSIYEFAALVFAIGGRREMLPRLEKERLRVENVCRDIAEYLALFWKKYGCSTMELFEYEQIFGLIGSGNGHIHAAAEGSLCAYATADADKSGHKAAAVSVNMPGRTALTDSKLQSLLNIYRKHMILESEENATELMQLYTDMQEYSHAQHWMEALEKLKARKSRLASLSRNRAEITSNAVNMSDALKIPERTPALMLERFAGRDDIFSMETAVGNQRRKTELQERPLTEAQIEEHLRGACTYGTYIQRPNSTVHYIIWDVDVSKQFILKYGNSGEAFDACLQKAYHKALEIQKLLDDKDIRSYVEFSGYRGYHVWLFLTEWIPIRFANMLTDRIEEEMASDEDVTVECFPNKVRLKPGRFGQVIKLPYGIHVRSGKRSFFMDDNGQPITELDSFMETLARYPLPTIRKVLTFAKSPSEEAKGGVDAVDNPALSDDVMNQELNEAFGELTVNVHEVLAHCSLMKYLCIKAKRTGYLTHFERMSVLHVFGHLGEEGKEFVHDVMQLTMNYQYNTTQRFIERLPHKPISCGKLREQYKKVSAEVGCSCSFKRTKNCYPSPVLYALSLSKDVQEDITIPTSRSLSTKKEKTVIDELNVHKKAQELAGRILELRKQQRAIDKNVAKVERELEKIYDSVGTDVLEIEMGMLVRRKKADGYEWVIEI